MQAKLLTLIVLLLFTINLKAQCTRTAPFQDGGYVVVGMVTMGYTLSGSKMLDIGSDFSTMNGPDLFVYLTNSTSITTSSSTVPDGTIELGLLTSSVVSGIVTGESTYTIPDNVEIDDYAYVVIQCKQFNAFWGFSQLGTQQGEDCSSLSVDDEVLNAITFYPNPAQDKIMFDINFQDELEIKIYNSFGMKIKQENISRSKNEVFLDNISAGIYFVELISDGKKSVKKLIIQ